MGSVGVGVAEMTPLATHEPRVPTCGARGVRTVVTAKHRCQVDSGKRVVSRDANLCKEFRMVMRMTARPGSPNYLSKYNLIRKFA
jgi:hypothetical protein